jgi:hypothetical protein
MTKSLSNKKTEKFEDFIETENPQLSLFALLEDDRMDGLPAMVRKFDCRV